MGLLIPIIPFWIEENILSIRAVMKDTTKSFEEYPVITKGDLIFHSEGGNWRGRSGEDRCSYSIPTDYMTEGDTTEVTVLYKGKKYPTKLLKETETHFKFWPFKQ